MKAHELARKLLELPDDEVVIGIIKENKDIDYCLINEIQRTKLNGLMYLEIFEDRSQVVDTNVWY